MKLSPSFYKTKEFYHMDIIDGEIFHFDLAVSQCMCGKEYLAEAKGAQ